MFTFQTVAIAKRKVTPNEKVDDVFYVQKYITRITHLF